MKKIQTGDKVIVISGADKGTISTVVAISGERVVVKWVHTVKKAKKGEGFIEKDLSVHISNIALYHGTKKTASKVGFKIEKGKKVRIYKKDGSVVKKNAK